MLSFPRSEAAEPQDLKSRIRSWAMELAEFFFEHFLKIFGDGHRFFYVHKFLPNQKRLKIENDNHRPELFLVALWICVALWIFSNYF